MEKREFLKGEVVKVSSQVALHRFAHCSTTNTIGVLCNLAAGTEVVVAEAPEAGNTRRGVFVHYYADGIPYHSDGSINSVVTNFLSGYIRRDQLEPIHRSP